MAYGARLESVLGASPRGFESPILRHWTPGPVEVPGFLLPVVPLVFRAPSGPAALMGRAAVCAGGRRPAREPSAPRASLGASSRSPARPRRRPPAPRPGPPAPSTPAALVSLGLARPGPAAAHRHRGQAHQTSRALRAGGACGAVYIGRQLGGQCTAEPRPRPLRLRGLRRSLHPGARLGPRPSQRASIGAGPSRCSSIRPCTPSR